VSEAISRKGEAINLIIWK